MGTTNIGDQHRLLIDALQKIYPDKDLKKLKGLTPAADLHKKFDASDTHFLAILCSRVLNMHGASVADVNFYKLLGSYILDPEKRERINRVL